MKHIRRTLGEQTATLLIDVATQLVLAVIESVDPHNVNLGHLFSLANLRTAVWDGGDGVLSTSDGEGCSAVVHDGGVVIGGVQVVGLLPVEVVGHAWRNVLPVDPDILVAVTPVLLVVEAQSVVDLVLDDAVVHAALFVEREFLPAPCHAQRGVASPFVLKTDVVILTLAGYEANTSFVVEGLHGVLKHCLIREGEGPAHCVGNGHKAIGGFSP